MNISTITFDIPRAKRVWDSLEVSRWADRNRYYDATCLILKTILILGISPVRITAKGEAEYSLWSKRTGCCILLLVLFFYYVSAMFLQSAATVARMSYNFATFTHNLVPFMALSPALVSPFATWIEKEGVVNYINAWSHLQERYERITHSRLDRIFEGSRKFCRIGTLVSVLTPLLTGLWAIHASLLKIYREILHFLPLTYGVMQNYLLFTFWLINVRIMSKLIQDYGKNFEQQIVRNPKVTKRMIEEYRQLWLDISLLTNQLSSVFIEKIGPHIIITTATTIMSVYVWIFYSVDVVNFRLDTLSLHIFYEVTTLFLVFSYCNSGYIIGKICEERVISKLLSIHSSSRHKSSKTKINLHLHEQFQIVLFSFSAKCFPPNINMSGCCGINRETLMTVFSASVTHIVILIQFRLATEDSLHLFKNNVEQS